MGAVDRAPTVMPTDPSMPLAGCHRASWGRDPPRPRSIASCLQSRPLPIRHNKGREADIASRPQISSGYRPLPAAGAAAATAAAAALLDVRVDDGEAAANHVLDVVHLRPVQERRRLRIDEEAHPAELKLGVVRLRLL